jgi:hypothetical protein
MEDLYARIQTMEDHEDIAVGEDCQEDIAIGEDFNETARSKRWRIYSQDPNDGGSRWRISKIAVGDDCLNFRCQKPKKIAFAALQREALIA